VLKYWKMVGKKLVLKESYWGKPKAPSHTISIKKHHCYLRLIYYNKRENTWKLKWKYTKVRQEISVLFLFPFLFLGENGKNGWNEIHQCKRIQIELHEVYQFPWLYELRSSISISISNAMGGNNHLRCKSRKSSPTVVRLYREKSFNQVHSSCWQIFKGLTKTTVIRLLWFE